MLEGISITKKRGAYTGREKITIWWRNQEACWENSIRKKKSQIAQEFSISRETLYQYLSSATNYQPSFGTRVVLTALGKSSKPLRSRNY